MLSPALPSHFENHGSHAFSALAGIYAIVDAALSRDPEEMLAALLLGGIRLFQYRAKAGVDRGLVRAMHRRTVAAGAVLIVNDDPLAALDADGLHVGQEDLATLEPGLRKGLGARILGISCGVPEDVAAARALGADYLGVGPFATTSSKADAGPAIGAQGVMQVVRIAGDLPVAAIGGIGLDQLEAVIASGARMAVVLSALVADEQPSAIARRFIRRWETLTR